MHRSITTKWTKTLTFSTIISDYKNVLNLLKNTLMARNLISNNSSCFRYIILFTLSSRFEVTIRPWFTTPLFTENLDLMQLFSFPHFKFLLLKTSKQTPNLPQTLIYHGFSLPLRTMLNNVSFSTVSTTVSTMVSTTVKTVFTVLRP